MPGAPKLASISKGNSYFCALDGTGAPYCWGVIIVDVDIGVRLGVTPTPLPGGLLLTQLSTGTHQVCGVTAAGDVVCWGDYNGGVRGDPSVDPDTANANFTPNVVAGGLHFRSVAAGLYSSCALTAAGAAYCWGSGFMGGLGDPAATTQTNCGFAWSPCTSQPVAVAGGLTFASLAAGESHFCALTAVGAIYCWGLDASGELGIDPFTLPACVQVGRGTAPCAPAPALVQAPAGLATIAAGGGSTCGIDSLQTAACWGNNDYGQLGNGGGEGSPYGGIPTLTFLQIAPGRWHSCALAVDSLAYCWGDNDYGELGTGTTEDASRPVAVVGPAAP